MKEAIIQKQIIDYLKHIDYIVIRNNSGFIRIGNRAINLGDAGSSDIIGMENKTGRFIAIEVKTEIGKLTEKQEAFLFKVREGGGIAFVARSVEDVIKALEEFRNERQKDNERIIWRF